ncbi:hypothetical protein EJ05DRAFT_219117 [Pseudovirgaria hyperparasitica]|uniref:Uncharacterized protein n=1 Tax=Pseudovirgaria hyperparasitica TaxID=470096 RepID=A0A6A6VUA5_9PEZI|nr:uncharacterized protein EJ05DRAFT_219117 [Pseudovirgaria hyperparasitica]KAF2753479.1 hypothetical protein EJ05DRAFT_219117 [Pseudovirgaria hyperparasitica]
MPPSMPPLTRGRHDKSQPTNNVTRFDFASCLQVLHLQIQLPLLQAAMNSPPMIQPIAPLPFSPQNVQCPIYERPSCQQLDCINGNVPHSCPDCAGHSGRHGHNCITCGGTGIILVPCSSCSGRG